MVICYTQQIGQMVGSSHHDANPARSIEQMRFVVSAYEMVASALVDGLLMNVMLCSVCVHLIPQGATCNLAMLMIKGHIVLKCTAPLLASSITFPRPRAAVRATVLRKVFSEAASRKVMTARAWSRVLHLATRGPAGCTTQTWSQSDQVFLGTIKTLIISLCGND